ELAPYRAETVLTDSESRIRRTAKAHVRLAGGPRRCQAQSRGLHTIDRSVPPGRCQAPTEACRGTNKSVTLFPQPLRGGARAGTLIEPSGWDARPMPTLEHGTGAGQESTARLRAATT